MSTPEPGTTPIIKTDDDLRAAAEERVKAKQSFRYQVALFAAITVVLVVIWAAAGASFPWFIFPIIGFAIALASQAWHIWGERPTTEADVQREMERLRARGQG